MAFAAGDVDSVSVAGATLARVDQEAAAEGSAQLPLFTTWVSSDFGALSLRPDPLGFWIGGSPDPSTCKHYQGIARSQGAGRPYLFVSRSGNVPFGCAGSNGPGNLLIVEMGSRDTNGERLRSNRLYRGKDIDSTAPHFRDTTVTHITFDGNGGWPNYGHPGGMQLVGDVLAVPLEEPYAGGSSSLIVFIDVSNPLAPAKLSTYAPGGKAGLVALAPYELSDGKCCGYLMLTTGGDNTEVRLFRSNPTDPDGTTDLKDLSLNWQLLRTLSEAQIESCLGADWPTGSLSQSHQMLNFVRNTSISGQLHLIGSRNTTLGEDWLDLYEVHADNGVPAPCLLTHVRSLHVTSHPTMDADEVLNFKAAAGTYVSPGGELIVYGTEHDNDGPSGTVKLGEYRHENVVRTDSLTYRPSVDGPDSFVVDEGSTGAVSATGRGPATKAWLQLYEDEGAGANSFSGKWFVFDLDDRDNEDYDDFRDLEEQLIGSVFDNKATSWRWFAPPGCWIQVNDLYNGEDGEHYKTLKGHDGWIEDNKETDLRTVRDDNGNLSMHDTISSMQFFSNCDGYYSAPIELWWDLDFNGSFETGGNNATYDATRLDGPTTKMVRVRAQHSTDTSSLGTGPSVERRIDVANVAPVLSTSFITDPRGYRLAIDTPYVFPGDELRLDASFTDPGQADTQTATIDWGDGTIDASVNFDVFSDAFGGATGQISQRHTYNQVGTYPMRLTVTDDDGGSLVFNQEIAVIVLPERVVERWIDQFQLGLGGESAQDAATDASGNVYVVGVRPGVLPSEETTAYVRQYNPWSFQWDREIGDSTNYESANGAATDAAGNVYVVGKFMGCALVGCSPPTAAFVSKYSPSGDVLWDVLRIWTPESDTATEVATDQDGNVYVVGYTKGNMEPGAYQGGWDGFIVKIDPQQNIIWRRQIATPLDDSAQDVATDASGNIYVIGDTDGVLPDGGGSFGERDAFVRKYNPSGDILWTDQFGSPGTEYGRGASTDNQGNIFISGWTTGVMLGGGGSHGGSDAYVSKYNSVGQHLWTDQFGSESTDASYDVSADPSGDVYAVGWTSGVAACCALGSWDGLVRKIGAQGGLLGESQFGSANEDYGQGAATDHMGNLFVAGYTQPEDPNLRESFAAKFGDFVPLHVYKWGAGSGTVTSSPAGIDCGTDCEAWFSYDTLVTLTATPDPDSVFSGWSGADCPGGSITIDEAKTCGATFDIKVHTLSVTKAGTGSGTVTSSPAGIDCGADCTEDYDYGTPVTVTAAADAISFFAGWSGDPDCSDGMVTMDSDKTCTATFDLLTYTLSVAKTGTGSGKVTSSPAGIDCGPDCREEYVLGTEVTLTATADPGSAFLGWSGDPDCSDGQVTMDSDESCTADFAALPTGTIVINGGDPFTTSPLVTLDLTCEDLASACVEMQFSEDDLTWTPWEPYQTTKAWDLGPENGFRNVYVRYKNGTGLISESFRDGIFFDNTAPQGTIAIEGGAPYATSTAVTLTLSCLDNHLCSEMRFSNDDLTWSSWEPYAASKAWTLTGGDGEKTVYVKYKDALGNVSQTFSDTITLDTQAPLIPENVVLTAVAQDEAMLSWDASTHAAPSGVAGYKVYDTKTGAEVADVPGGPYFLWPLAPGNHSYYVKAYDLAGNVSARSRFASVRLPVRFDWQSVDILGKTFAANPAGATATASFILEGEAVTINYGCGLNTGIFEVSIDGVVEETVDAYCSPPDFSAQKYYDFATPGGHTIEVRPTGQKNPSSLYYWTLIDSFEVAGETYEEDDGVSYTWQTVDILSQTFSANPAGATASSSFTYAGDSVSINYGCGLNTGIFDVEIDGAVVDTVDAYCSPPDFSAQKTYLTTPDTHTVTVRPTGSKNLASLYYWTLIDSFEAGGNIYQAQALPRSEAEELYIPKSRLSKLLQRLPKPVRERIEKRLESMGGVASADTISLLNSEKLKGLLERLEGKRDEE